MSKSRVRENLTHGLMRGKRAKPSNLLYTMVLLFCEKLVETVRHFLVSDRDTLIGVVYQYVY